MAVSVGLQFIHAPCAAIAGSAIGTDKYQFGHHVMWLPDRLLVGTPSVKICRMGLQMDGYGGAGGALLVFLDKGMRASNESLWPLTQNANYMHFQLVAQVAIYPSTIILPPSINIDPPIEYVPGQDGLIYVIDGAPSPNPPGFVLLPSLAMDAMPAWASGDPADMPDPNAAGGNDQFTSLLLHCKGVDGSPLFQDNSFRNYTVRYFGGVRVQSGYAYFSGNGCLAPELYAPGYGSDMNPAHNDWNPGSATFTLDLKVKPSALSTFGTVAAFGNSYGPFVIAQQGSGYTFYCSTTGTSWNVANGVSMGAAASGTEVHLAVVRSSSSILLFNNGVLIATLPISGALFYPLFAGGNGRGRLMFGAQADIDGSGNITAGGYFTGFMKEMRWSKTARWTTNFIPPAAPYSP